MIVNLNDERSDKPRQIYFDVPNFLGAQLYLRV